MAGTHLFWFVCVSFCIALGVWAYLGQLDIVSTADGKVVPSSKVKEVQHLEGGIVSEILVKEGDEVKLNQPLLTLEGTSSDANVRELEIRIVSLQVDIARLKAQTRETEAPKYSKNLRSNHSSLVKESESLFKLQNNKYHSELASQKELIKQRAQDVKEIETRISSNQEGLELLKKQIDISEKLLQDNLTTEYKHLSFLREESGLKSKIEEDKAALKRASSQIESAEEKLKRVRHSFREKAAEELKKSQQELDEFLQRLKKFKDSQRRTVIRAPVDGVVKTLYLYTVGGVVAPGKTIMDIVPTSDTLVVEAHLPIGDIGYVALGQKTVVKLASPDARRYGKLDGEVYNISPDTVSDQNGRTYYNVRIKTEKNYFEWGPDQYQLVPGMQVVSYIHTGKRSVLAYLLDPFIDSMGQALQER